MKNKKVIAGVVLGIMLGSGVGYAATQYLASEIDYTKSSGETVKVDQALNELYALKGTGVTTNDSSNIYSEEPQVVGTWIDGKPIYRQTIIGDNIPKTGTVLISNVDTVVNGYGEQLYDNRIWYHFPYSTALRWELYIENHTIRVLADVSKVTAFKWTFEYTKVTETVQ